MLKNPFSVILTLNVVKGKDLDSSSAAYGGFLRMTASGKVFFSDNKEVG